MEDFSVQVSQIAHHENEDGLDDANVVGKTGDETREEAPNDANKSTANRHHNKGGETRQNVGVFDVFLAHADVGVEHVV